MSKQEGVAQNPETGSGTGVMICCSSGGGWREATHDDLTLTDELLFS